MILTPCLFPLLTLTHVKPLGDQAGGVPMISDLSVMPTRVAFDDGNRACTFTLLNRGSRAMRYRLVVQDMRMTDDGGLEKMDDYDHSAKDFLRFAPREVLVPGGTWQKIKVVVSAPSGLSTGEYRSHLLFEPVDVADAPIANMQGGTSKIKIELRMQTAVTVPVFFSHGRLNGQVQISDISVAKGDKPGVCFDLHREGAKTVRGNISVWFYPKNSQKRLEVGRILELPIYYPNLVRHVFVDVEPNALKGRAGDLAVEFAEPGSPSVSARTTIATSR